MQLAWQFGELINTGDRPQLGNLLPPNLRFAGRYCSADRPPLYDYGLALDRVCDAELLGRVR